MKKWNESFRTLFSQIERLTATITLALIAPLGGCSTQSQQSALDKCAQAAPVSIPAQVDSWSALTSDESFRPNTGGWFFAETYYVTCSMQGKVELNTRGTYLRFFKDGTVRRNDLTGGSYPQDPKIVMEQLSHERFDNPGFAGAVWGCCPRNRGTYDKDSFTLEKFGGGGENWKITDIGDNMFSAVELSSTGTGGWRYDFEFHPQ